MVTKSGSLKPFRCQNYAKIEVRCQSIKIRNQVDAIIIKARKPGVAANRPDLQCYGDGENDSPGVRQREVCQAAAHLHRSWEGSEGAGYGS